MDAQIADTEPFIDDYETTPFANDFSD